MWCLTCYKEDGSITRAFTPSAAQLLLWIEQTVNDGWKDGVKSFNVTQGATDQ